MGLPYGIIDPVIDNQLAAQLLFEHKLATQEDILACWPYITPEKDVGAVLVEKGILQRQTYREMIAYLQTMGQAVSQSGPSGSSDGDSEMPPASDEMSFAEIPAPGQSPGGDAWTAAPPEGEGTIQFELNVPDIPKKGLRSRNSAAKDAAAQEAAPQPVATQPIAVAPPVPAKDSRHTASPAAGRPPSGADTRVPEALGPDVTWEELLAFARHHDAADIHLSSGNPILLRRYGYLQAATGGPVGQASVRRWVESALDPGQLALFDEKGDLEIIYALPGWGRYRVTLMKQRRGWDITARVIPARIRSMEEAGLPESCRDLTRWAQGLVLVTGPVGCGKSSTLATFVEMVNQERHDHIISIEEPIEIVYEPAHCRITQREIGPHTLTRDAALRAALREDPDIIVISELRDLDTIRLAISAAETGHLVFGTMNTTNAARTIYRLIDSFPPEEQGIIRNMISESLRGVVSQQLIPRRDGQGMVPAFEVLLINGAVSNMIRKDEAHQLGTAMITGKASGMVLLDDSLRALVERGFIDPMEAMARANTPKDFEKYTGRSGR